MPFNHFAELLAQKVTRKQFLLHLGVLMLAITGISGLLKTLSDPHLINKQAHSSRGFGGGAYGG